MRFLLTGFQPFGGESINPAYEAVKMLPDEICLAERENAAESEVCTAEIIKREIPVVFGEGADKVLEAIREVKPDVIICVGQAGGRKGVTPEKVAINLQDARIPDNNGNSPQDQPIRNDGPAAWFTDLPVKAIVQAMRDEGIEASVSYSAGTYVCNDVMYRLLDALHTEMEGSGMIGGFIHVPYCTEQVKDKPGIPSLPLESIAKGLLLAVQTIQKQYQS